MLGNIYILNYIRPQSHHAKSKTTFCELLISMMQQETVNLRWNLVCVQAYNITGRILMRTENREQRVGQP